MNQPLANKKVPPRRSLGDYLSANVKWFKTKDPTEFWRAQVGPEEWTVRVNDFPEEHLYTLFANDEKLGSFDDWPRHWSRAEDDPTEPRASASGA